MRLLLLSNGKHEGMAYLEHAAGYLRDFLGGAVDEILFVPCAAVTKTYDQFVEQIRPVFDGLGVRVIGVHDGDALYRVHAEFAPDFRFARELCRQSTGYTIGRASDVPPIFVQT